MHCRAQAIAAWRDNSGYGRCQLVKSYFQAVEGFSQPEVLLEVPAPGGGSGRPTSLLDRLLTWLPQRAMSDPFYAVVARRTEQQ